MYGAVLTDAFRFSRDTRIGLVCRTLTMSDAHTDTCHVERFNCWASQDCRLSLISGKGNFKHMSEGPGSVQIGAHQYLVPSTTWGSCDFSQHRLEIQYVTSVGEAVFRHFMFGETT